MYLINIYLKFIMSQHSLENLYQEHYSWLQHWLRGRIGCEHNAQDLAQDTYLKLLASQTLLNIEQPRQYLVRIAKSLMIDAYRRKQVEQAYLNSLAEQPEAYMPSTETQVLVLEALIEVDNMLQGLPSKVRSAFLLRQLDGLSYKDIAQQLQVSLSSVEKYVARALTACCLYKLT